MPPSKILPSQSIEDLLNKSQKELKKVGRQNKKTKKESKRKNDSQKENSKESGNEKINSNMNVKINKSNIGLKYNKSIETLRKEDIDEIILERS